MYIGRAADADGETMDFEFFRRNIFPPEDYSELFSRTYDGEYLDEVHIPYMLVYDTFSGICREQRGIVERCEDATALSAIFKRLPKLTELDLCFCQTLAKEHWVPLFMDQTVERNTYGHHFRVISEALKVGIDYGTSIHTFHLSGLELPYYCSLRTLEAQSLSAYLYGLLRCARSLRLSGSGSPLKPLSYTTLRLQWLDLCCVIVTQATLDAFLWKNASSIRSIGFHDTRLIGSDSTESDSAAISPELCRSSLQVYQAITSWEASRCLVCGQRGWRLSKT